MTQANARRSCPSCSTTFTPARSNQRYCAVECREYGSNVRRGLTSRVPPEEFRRRRKEKLCSAVEKPLGAPQSAPETRDNATYQKLCNENGKPIETKGSTCHFSSPKIPLVPGWTGMDGDRGFRVFLPYQQEPLSRLQCRQINVRYPAIDRGVYRVL